MFMKIKSEQDPECKLPGMFAGLIPFAFASTDVQGNVQEWNKEAEDLLGYTREQIVGRQLLRVLVEPEVELDRLEATQEWVLMPIRRADSNEILVEVRLSSTQSGCIFWFFRKPDSVLYDSQDGMRSLHNIAHARRMLEMVLNNAPVIIIDVDAQGRFRFARGKGLERIHRTPAQLEGLNVTAAYADAPGILEQHHRAMKGESFQAENTHRGLSYLSYFAPHKDQHGKPAGYTAVINDVTDLHRAYRDVEQAEALAARSLQVREHFLASVSHELRNPLMGIVGISELLSSGKNEPELLDTLQQYAQYLTRMVDDLLDLTRLRSGQFTLVDSPFSPTRLLDSLATWARVQAQRQQLDVNYKVNTLPEAVLGDPQRWEQLLMNLLQNALRYSKKGTISIRAQSIIYNSLSYISVTVTNPTTPTRSDGKGAGIGLQIVTELADRMGVIYTCGRTGSEYAARLLFPAHSLAATLSRPAAHREAEPVSLKGKTVLLVEDHSMIRLLATTMLRNIGLEVTECVNLEQMSSLLGTMSPPDYLLMDQFLPDGDGLEAARNLRQQGCKMGIVLASATRPEVYYGVDVFLPKPYTALQLEMALRQATVPPISLHKLQNFFGTDVAALHETLELGLNQLQEDLEALGEAPPEAKAAIAHKMKTTFVQLDAQEAAALAQAVEQHESQADWLKLWRWGTVLAEQLANYLASQKVSG